jgi:hypothetical protein
MLVAITYASTGQSPADRAICSKSLVVDCVFEDIAEGCTQKFSATALHVYLLGSQKSLLKTNQCYTQCIRNRLRMANCYSIEIAALRVVTSQQVCRL